MNVYPIFDNWTFERVVAATHLPNIRASTLKLILFYAQMFAQLLFATLYISRQTIVLYLLVKIRFGLMLFLTLGMADLPHNSMTNSIRENFIMFNETVLSSMSRSLRCPASVWKVD